MTEAKNERNLWQAVKWKAAVTMVLTEAAAGNQTMRKYAGKGDKSLDGAEIAAGAFRQQSCFNERQPVYTCGSP